MGAAAPLTATLPRSLNSTSSGPRCGTARRYVSSVIWTQPGGQEVSVRDAMLTVLPKMQKRRGSIVYQAMVNSCAPNYSTIRVCGHGSC